MPKKVTKKQTNQAVKAAKKHPKLVVALGAIIVIALAVFVVLYLLKPEIFRGYRNEYLDYVRSLYTDSSDDDPEGTAARAPKEILTADQTDIINSEFSIHFLELGNKYAGDCTLIKCGSTEVLIDAGSRTNSATTINSYLSRYVDDNKIEYVVATHAHQDHIAGFVGTGSGNNKNGVLYSYDIGTIIQFAGHNTNSNVYKNYLSAVKYAEDNKGAVTYTALECWQGGDAEEGARKSFDLKGDGTLTLNILNSYYYNHETDDENDYSVCVLLSYTPVEGNASHYLFTGDLEGKGEEYLVSLNPDLPEVELFKGGHHGSKTSSTDKLLNVIKPKNVAVCCCAGSTEYTSNPDNTFPTQAFIDRISKHTDNVFCTSLCTDYKGGKFESMNGDIVFMYLPNSEEHLKMWCSNNSLKLRQTDWFKANRKCEAWDKLN